MALEKSEHQTVVVKEMAVASYGCYDYIPSGFLHILLIRDPHRVIPSMRTMTVAGQGREANCADVDLEKIHKSYPTLHWFGEMYELWGYLKANVDPNPLIIDSDEFLSNPAPYLRKICEMIGTDYRDELLQWEASKDVTTQWKHACIDLYTDNRLIDPSVLERAFSSSCFVPTSSPKPTLSDLTPDCARIVGKCVDSYNAMFQCRFIPEK